MTTADAQPITQVDAFTDRPFTGNPAGVCVLPAPRDARWMGQVALEMNLAETAFLTRQADGFDLRWFTPAAEVDLCGHATLASAHVLWEEGHLPPDATARFHTRSGLLTAERRDGMIWLDFPATPPQSGSERSNADMEALSTALRIRPVSVSQTRFDHFVEVDSEAAVRALQPDFHLLERLGSRGVIVTAIAGPGSSHDFVSRFFAPALGIPEDPVTGSAHCALAPFWGERFGRDRLIGYQASPRGGTVHTRTVGDRVHLGGTAVTVLRGTLLH